MPPRQHAKVRRGLRPKRSNRAAELCDSSSLNLRRTFRQRNECVWPGGSQAVQALSGYGNGRRAHRVRSRPVNPESRPQEPGIRSSPAWHPRTRRHHRHGATGKTTPNQALPQGIGRHQQAQRGLKQNHRVGVVPRRGVHCHSQSPSLRLRARHQHRVKTKLRAARPVGV